MTLGTALLFGLVPAWQASSAALLAEMTGSGGRTSTGRAGGLRAVLVVAEVAAAVLLLSGAGLLVRTLLAMNHVDAGFRADRVLTMQVGLPLRGYTKAEELLRLLSVERSARSRRFPASRASRSCGSLPLDGWDIGQGFAIQGDPPVEKSKMLSTHYQIVSATYFATLGIDMVRGRAFNEYDTARTAPVCIVNEEFVRRHLRGREPIGTIVGVYNMDMCPARRS